MIRSISTLAFAIVATGARAQNMQLADNGPRFLSVPAPNAPSVDASGAPVLQRRVTLEFDRLPLEAALTEVGKQARVRLLFSTAVLSVTQPVSVHADGITVAAALTELLIGQHIDVQVSTDGAKLSLVPRDAELSRAAVLARQQGTGTITGHVTDGVLKTPLPAVSVRIEGTTLGTTANADGKYTITGLVAGTYRATARRVGYQPLTKDVTVTSDEQATLDFALTAAPTRLDEVVTTAVGQQRRYEVGNDISTINADSITPTAPITSLTDLISARAPGVEVLETGGLTGSGEAIRIRGLSSLVLQGDPIIIVDGIRQDNAAGGSIVPNGQQTSTYPSATPTPSRLNDIDFNDVATIDVLKGPSASTEYGTDAANGVIVITTKHGSAGAPQWNASAERTESDIPVGWPNYDYSWGHLTDGTNRAVQCVLTSAYNPASTSGACVVDSVTQWNPLNNPYYSVFGTGNRGKYDLSVAGGSDAVRYFVAGGLTNETGIARLPDAFRAEAISLGYPQSSLNPNGEDQRSIRANTSIRLGSTADLSINAAYMSTYQDGPESSVLYYGAFSSPPLRDSAHFYGYGVNYDSPLATAGVTSTQNTSRLTGGLTANWRPAPWLAAHGTVGIDHGSQSNTYTLYPQIAFLEDEAAGQLGIGNGGTDIYTADLRASGTALLTSAIRSVTSVGLQMADTRASSVTAYTSTETTTNLTLNGTVNPMVTQQANRAATLGGYGEEQLSLRDRLFLTGALRVDAGSGFGRSYSTAEYPKASISWLAVDQGRTTVRLRAAYGQSGVQPYNGSALQLYAPTTVWLNGQAEGVGELSSPGNPTLRPERSTEYEGGADIGLLGNRVSIEVTGYSKTTNDALFLQSLGLTLGDEQYEENIGTVSNAGAEATVTATIVQGRSVTWDATVNASVNKNELISLAPGVASQVVIAAAYQTERQAVGYPLYGLWGDRYQYADVNHDGIIEASELSMNDSASYLGPSLPTREVSLGTRLGLGRGVVSVSALFDYRGGFRVQNTTAFNAAGQGEGLEEQNDPATPLALQARDIASQLPPYLMPASFFEDGSYVRFRELSVTVAAPQRFVRAAHVASASLTGAVRNLSLWTRYTGGDPEVTSDAGSNAQTAFGTTVVNNNIRQDYGAVPLARYWVLRLNVGLR